MPNFLKFVSLATLELLPFNAQKFTGSRNSGYAPFLAFFSGAMSGLSINKHPKLEVCSFSPYGYIGI